MLGRRVITSREVAIAMKIADGRIYADPAIDLSKSNIDEYKESLFDLKHIVCKPGEELTYFRIQPMTRRQKDFAEGLDIRESANFKLRCALLGIKNYKIEKEDGSVIDAPQPIRKENGNLGMMSSEDYIDDLNLPLEHLIALSLMITTISEAQLPLLKPCAPVAGEKESNAQENTKQ